MIINSLELKDFRNYKELKIDFDGGVNILYGDNAQGKTNVLEAVYYTATTRSHKGSKDKDVINFMVYVTAMCYFISSNFGNSMYYTSPYFMILLGFLIGMSGKKIL